MTEAREEIRQREGDLEKVLRRQMEDDREKGAIERKEKSKLQKEMETLEANYQELEN